LDDIRPDIEVLHATGRLSIREVLVAVFFFRVPHLQMADLVPGVLRRYVTLVGGPAGLLYYDEEGDAGDLSEDTLEELLLERLLTPSRLPNATIELTGGGVYAPEHYLWYNGKALDIRPFPKEASYLWFWLPRGDYLQNKGRVEDFLDSVASSLPISFGHAGFGLSGDNKQQKQALARRYPGLDISHPGCVSGDLEDKAAGSFWRNYLSPSLCSRLGGIDKISGALPGVYSITEMVGGKCRITLSEFPQIGDVNRRETLPENRALARFFRENGVFHIPERVVYFEEADGSSDREAMQRWHGRFLE
jgi:hypothetical protein